MRDYFTINGTPSKDFGVYLASANIMDAPKRNFSEVTVPGRNGTLLYDNGNWENQDLKAVLYIPKDVRNNAAAFRSFLLSLGGYFRYEDTLHPEEYRIASLSNAFEMDSSDRRGGSMTVTFNCKPLRYLKVGEYSTTFTQSGTLYSKFYVPAKPLLRVYGYGTFQVGTGTLSIASDVDGYLDIDCDLKDAYRGSLNRNSFLTVTKWPELTKGVNNITFPSTISKIELTPRWVSL